MTGQTEHGNRFTSCAAQSVADKLEVRSAQPSLARGFQTPSTGKIGQKKKGDPTPSLDPWQRAIAPQHPAANHEPGTLILGLLGATGAWGQQATGHTAGIPGIGLNRGLDLSSSLVESDGTNFLTTTHLTSPHQAHFSSPLKPPSRHTQTDTTSPSSQYTRPLLLTQYTGCCSDNFVHCVRLEQVWPTQ